MADKATQELERIYTIPLREVKASPRNHQADRAIRHIKKYLSRHMKSEDIWIDASVNEAIWARGMYTVPSRIRVRARKFDDGVVEVSLPEVETKASIREDIKSRKERKDKEKEEKKKEAEKKRKEEEAKEAESKAGESKGEEEKEGRPEGAKGEGAKESPPESKERGPGAAEKAPESKPATAKPSAPKETGAKAGGGPKQP